MMYSIHNIRVKRLVFSPACNTTVMFESACLLFDCRDVADMCMHRGGFNMGSRGQQVISLAPSPESTSNHYCTVV